MSPQRTPQRTSEQARERRLRWLVFGGVTLALVVMALVFIVVGDLAT